MRWSVKLVKFWIEHYYMLKSHSIKFWQEQDNYAGEVAIHSKGSRFRAPFIATADKNIEFDLAIKSLGDLGSQIFRLIYLDGLDIEDAIKVIDYPVKQIIARKRGLMKEFINYLLDCEK